MAPQMCLLRNLTVVIERNRKKVGGKQVALETDKSPDLIVLSSSKKVQRDSSSL